MNCDKKKNCLKNNENLMFWAVSSFNNPWRWVKNFWMGVKTFWWSSCTFSTFILHLMNYWTFSLCQWKCDTIKNIQRWCALWRFKKSKNVEDFWTLFFEIRKHIIAAKFLCLTYCPEISRKTFLDRYATLHFDEMI